MDEPVRFCVGCFNDSVFLRSLFVVSADLSYHICPRIANKSNTAFCEPFSSSRFYTASFRGISGEVETLHLYNSIREHIERYHI